jgi:predicted DNA-binding transcriptional regulator
MPGIPEFRFLTNHGNALLLIIRDPRIRIREIAELLDISEHAAQRVVADLSKAGYLDLRKEGRRNIYSVKTDLPLHLPFQRDVDIKALLRLIREHNNQVDTASGE